MRVVIADVGVRVVQAGNVYVTAAHQGVIWRVGKDGGAATAWVTSPLLKPTRPPPAIGANGLAFNTKYTALFVADTAQDTIIKIPVTGSPLEPGTPEVFVNRAGGGPDGIIIDEHDNLWIACNQSDEVMVLEPTQGRVGGGGETPHGVENQEASTWRSGMNGALVGHRLQPWPHGTTSAVE